MEEFDKHRLLHIPEGVRDLYKENCTKKLKLEEKLHLVFKQYGFQDIQTPSFEFFDIFNQERGTVSSKEMYKFFDREGNTLVLRPDLTPSIARCVAKYLKEEEMPIRLCYKGNTFINHSSYQGKLKETTQLGVELINDNTEDADAELIALTIACLREAGLEEFQVEIGHADFFYSLLEEAKFSMEEAKQLRFLIENKNVFGMEEFIAKTSISQDLKELFLKLPELFGTVEILSFAKARIKSEPAIHAILRLEALYFILEEYEISQYITFDLGMLSKYNYYTGIIFKAYTFGNGEPIAKGGRYDQLVQQFGKEASAIGMAIVLDQLMSALIRQKKWEENVTMVSMILYKKEYRKKAIDLANHFRNKGQNIELICMSSNRELYEYKNFAKRENMETFYYMEQETFVHVITVQDGCVTSAALEELLK